MKPINQYINPFIQKILRSYLLRISIIVLKRISIPGFGGVAVYYILEAFFKGITKVSLTDRAAIITYKFFIALFPGLIFIFSLIPFISIEGFDVMFMDILKTTLPQAIFEMIQEPVNYILAQKNNSILSLGLIVSIIFSASGIEALISTFNSSANVTDTRSAFTQYLIAIALTLMLFLILVVTIIFLLLNQSFLEYLVDHNWLNESVSNKIKSYRWVVLGAMVYFSVSTIYFLAPAKAMRWRFFSAGALLATLVSLLATYLFSKFIGLFLRYNSIYGTLGTVPALMYLIYINALTLLIGFELNASIKHTSSKGIFYKARDFINKKTKPTND